MSKEKTLRYWIKGVHPLSDSEWYEDETFNLKDKAFDHMIDLDDLSPNGGYWVVWDSWNREEVSKHW